MEPCGLQACVPGQGRPQAHLVLLAAGRAQIEAETTIRPRVGQLAQGGRLEPLRPTGIEIQAGSEGKAGAHAGSEFAVGDPPTVVAVAGDQIVIVHLERHFVVAQAQLDIQPLSAPRQLQVGRQTADLVPLVPSQATFHPQQVADKVLITLAVIHRYVVIDAASEDQLAGPDQPWLNPAGVQPVVVTLEIDNAAGLRWAGLLHGAGDRQELHDAALPAVQRGLPLRSPKILLVVDAHLLLVHGLARVVQQRIGRVTTWVPPIGCPIEPLRVLGVVLLQIAVDQCQPAVRRGDGELGEALVDPRRAVMAEAIQIETGLIEHEATPVRAGLETHPVPPRAPASEGAARQEAWIARTVAGEQLNHPARVAAIHTGEGAAQHFDVIEGIQVETRRLALAVGDTRRDPVAEQLDATDAKRRARPEAADRQLRLLREVVALPHAETGYALQCLRQVNARVALPHIAKVNPLDGKGLRVHRRLKTTPADHHRTDLDGSYGGATGE